MITFRTVPKPKPRLSNTFRRNPEPRTGYIDARRNDGCVPTITEVPAAARVEPRSVA